MNEVLALTSRVGVGVDSLSVLGHMNEVSDRREARDTAPFSTEHSKRRRGVGNVEPSKKHFDRLNIQPDTDILLPAPPPNIFAEQVAVSPRVSKTCSSG